MTDQDNGSEPDFEVSVVLSSSDLVLLLNTLNEALQIEDWEFHTRLGADRAEALELYDRLDAHLGVT